MSKDYSEAFDRIASHTEYDNDSSYDCVNFEDDCKLVDNALGRLEAIDNSNPSEALECLKDIGETCYVEAGNAEEDCILYAKDYIGFNTIKNALLKAQEPKQYLKWEDLEFNHTPKMTDVKMNGNKYKLVVGYNVAGKNLAILRDGKKEYYFLECDKQFFNDLHLERVEE